MTIHTDDFADAHHRHWEDAELLFGNERWANADQLYGFSAECGLKAVMWKIGMEVDDTGKPKEKKYRKHIQEIWLLFKDFANSRSRGHLVRELPGGTPFNDWSHHDRYTSRNHFGRNRVDPHRNAARGVLNIVQRTVGEDEP